MTVECEMHDCRRHSTNQFLARPNLEELHWLPLAWLSFSCCVQFGPLESCCHTCHHQESWPFASRDGEVVPVNKQHRIKRRSRLYTEEEQDESP